MDTLARGEDVNVRLVNSKLLLSDENYFAIMSDSPLISSRLLLYCSPDVLYVLKG